MNGHSVANASLADRWQAARRDAAGWFSVSQAVPERPLDLVARAQALGRPYVFWQSADRRLSLLGVGDLLHLQASGPDRLEAVAEASRTLSAPILLGAFAFADRGPLAGPFAPFAPADFIVPQLLFEERNGQSALRLFGRGGDGGPAEAAPDLLAALLATAPLATAQARLRFADPPGSRDAWRDEVERAREAIRAGNMEKVVLARTSLALATRPIDAARVLRSLARREQDCSVFAVHRDGHTFLGATPELLVRVAGGVAEVACLAGSAPRGRTPQEDRIIGQELLGSAKNRAEHAFVVQAVEAALEQRGMHPDVPAAPGLMQLHSVQHLFTPVRALLGPRETIFTLAGALHPTPAMGGTPRRRAQAWIHDHEQVSRGLYSGGVGYWRDDGEGELDVSIRCALVRGSLATLWAGCGIVEDSDPEEELRETELKFRPLRQALREASGP